VRVDVEESDEETPIAPLDLHGVPVEGDLARYQLMAR
jgi:hypothetical protein